MGDELLSYYNRELSFIRRLGGEFAETHPKIAGRLQLTADSAEDPHVERIIEAFAYLNARIRCKLDDDFPEITAAFLNVLYPHYQAPVPSMAIARFVPDRSQGELTTGYAIPGGSLLETDPVDGQPCRFHTAYPVTLWPIELASAELNGRPFRAPETVFSPKAESVLRLAMRCVVPQTGFADLNIGSLRFFLKGQTQHVYGIYELLFNNTLGVAVAGREGQLLAARAGGDWILPVGFEREEGLLPYTSRSMLGYRLLTEFFTFPQKFLFLDLACFDSSGIAEAGDSLDVFVYLNKSSTDLERNVTADMFQMGCTPIVNLFGQRAEPIALTHTETQYRVIPDARRPRSHEIYAIDRVTATSPDNRKIEFLPFFSFKHAGRREDRAFWYATRTAVGQVGGESDEGTEVFLSLVDLDFESIAAADWTLNVETTCLNRNLPRRLPFGQGQLRLHLSKGGPFSAIDCLTRPTATCRPADRKGQLWRLISHLSLGHVSLTDGKNGADALREILKLYDFADSSETRSMIEGVLEIAGRRIVGRVPGDHRGGVCRGVEVAIHLDEGRFTGTGAYLFACVLERFLGLYCSVNSFSRLIVTTNQREGALRKWRPRAGETVLL
jgi:type VI secretion system protein ImpG